MRMDVSNHSPAFDKHRTGRRERGGRLAAWLVLEHVSGVARGRRSIYELLKTLRFLLTPPGFRSSPACIVEDLQGTDQDSSFTPGYLQEMETTSASTLIRESLGPYVVSAAGIRCRF